MAALARSDLLVPELRPIDDQNAVIPDITLLILETECKESLSLLP